MQEQSRKYLIYLVILMGSVALLDWYLSTAIAVALPHLLEEYSIKDFEFSMWEALYLIPTLFIFLLNGLNDIIGRKLSILLLLLLMGLPSIAIFYFANNFHLFMIFYAIINFALVSNMWTIPMEEEAPASSRGKLMGIVYSISLIPLAPIASFIIIPRFGWKGIYAFGFVFMLLIIFGWLFMRETKRYEKIKEERKKGIRKKHFFGIGVIKKKDFRYIAIGTAIWFCWLAISFHLKYVGHYLQDIKNYSQNTFLLVFLVAQVLCIFAGFLAGWMMDKVGRGKTLAFSCIAVAILLILIDFSPGNIVLAVFPITYFFFMFMYTWIIVYLPEIFPTEIRGSCLGWTTTTARPSYIIVPLIISGLLRILTDMKFFWTFTALYPLIAFLIVIFTKPYETKKKELEEIEVERS